MATRQVINNGTVANDGTGDTLRSAATKINENFVDLFLAIGGDSNSFTNRITLDSDGAIVFEGAVADAFETKLNVTEPTKDNTITLPDSTGTVTLNNTVATLTNKTLADVITTGNVTIKDSASASSYIFTPGNIIANRTVTIPVLTGDDTITFNAHTATLTNKTINDALLNNPKIGGSPTGGHIFDSAGAKILEFTSTASAVNHITVANSATGNALRIDVEGDDTNIGLDIGAKGTGVVSFENSTALEKGTDITGSTAVVLTQPLTVFNSATLISPTIANGNAQGQLKAFINRGAGEARLVSSTGSANIFGVDSSNGFLSFDEGDGCQLVWNGDENKWFLIGNNGTTTG